MNTCAPQLLEHPKPLPSAFVPAASSLRCRQLAVGVIGPGRVGSAVLGQLRAAQPRLEREGRVRLRLCGVVASKRMWLDCDDAELNGRAGGAQVWRPNDLDAFAAHVRGGAEPRDALLIDCSASDTVASRYADWLADGLHVVTPNKLAGSGALARWHTIRHASAASGARFRYEATVCAGLPVVQTLRDLLDTGDELLAVEGMFSGTLAWLCNRHDGAQPFSALVREAHALGYTEPDPRDDLSGMDVARKLVILAREAGWALSLDDVAVESLVPASLATLSREEFMQRLDELDAPLAARLAAARAEGGVLRHVAHLDARGRASVKLAVLPAAHAFAHSRLTDNVVQFTTRRYCDNPLLVQGPGAGPEVTAAGIFADLLRIAESLELRA
ncbi:homoserine dehydrogenase [Dyella sp.]|uniref:homoserine dehydrogenase n=1 Tax=Dyella sp. TaxID=1869338 RepID=UPI002D79C5BD|nr:homoserine dehydrogenase [Dyella sp.]HET6431549.1 homoserine dehydrogenase [Dyella sp.]